PLTSLHESKIVVTMATPFWSRQWARRQDHAPSCHPRRPQDLDPLTATMRAMLAPGHGDDWVGITADSLPIAAAYEWAVRRDCGAVVLFSGTVRDHAEGRGGVQHLTYEAYEEQAVPRMQAIADEVRVRWPQTGRVVLLHRTGRLELGESSVIVVVSSPHRREA